MSRMLVVALSVVLVAGPAFAGTPTESVSLNFSAPEIDVGSASVALTILAGGLALLRERFRK